MLDKGKCRHSDVVQGYQNSKHLIKTSLAREPLMWVFFCYKPFIKCFMKSLLFSFYPHTPRSFTLCALWMLFSNKKFGYCIACNNWNHFFMFLKNIVIKVNVTSKFTLTTPPPKKNQAIKLTLFSDYVYK